MNPKPILNISTESQNDLNEIIENAINDNIIPGIEILFFKNKEILFHQVYGNKRIKPHTEKLDLNSIFDIASITKIVITSVITMILLEKGKLTLNTPVSRYFDEYKNGDKSKITLFHLLTHTSGLAAWKNLYEISTTKEEAYSKLLTLNLEYKPGEKMIYSCMGFITLKLIFEKITGDSLDNLAQKNILAPLEMEDSFFNPDKKLLDRIVPTGDCEWRKRLLHGEVHDENCSFLGGTSGNAGLFSTARDLHNFAIMLLSKGQFKSKKLLSEPSVKLLLSNQLPGHLSPRGIGFQLKDSEHRPSGELFSRESAGHLGFTGTSFWIDPISELGVILLSNRVHISYRDNIEGIKPLRMKLQNILLASKL